jgi:hypothetical protein
MVDVSSIAAAIGSLKTAAEIAKGFLDLKETAAVQGKVIELQGVILAAQSAALAGQSEQFSLLEKVRELETEMAKVKAWETQKQRYDLVSIGTRAGLFAYALKPECRGAEPPHYICANCYEDGRKSILQFHQQYGKLDTFICSSCKTEISSPGGFKLPV